MEILTVVLHGYNQALDPYRGVIAAEYINEGSHSYNLTIKSQRPEILTVVPHEYIQALDPYRGVVAVV